MPSPRASSPQSRNAATAILVLGMHRSGTSAIARVLNLRGADLGRDLLPAKQDNERGFWENRAILQLHETLLEALGVRWLDLIDLPPGWQRGEPARRFAADLPAVLRQEFGNRPLFTVKDPRLALLTPLWIEVLDAIAVRPAFVITVRHPLEVAASLARRDGLSSPHSQLLWLQHLIEAERATRGRPRVFVHYERLLADWRGELERIGAQLALEWPAPAADFAANVDQFLAPTLRHHRSGDAGDSLLPGVAQAYSAALAATLGPAPAAPFDALGLDATALIGSVAALYRDLERRRQAEARTHADEIGRARASFAAKELEIEKAREAFVTKEREIDLAREAFAAKEQEIDLARDAIAAKDQEIARAREAAAVREGEIDAARRSIETLTVELGQARAIVEGKDQEIAAARINVDTLTTELGLARDNIHALAGEITVAREAFAAKEREIDAARTNIETLAADLETARQAHAVKDDEIAALRVRLEEFSRGIAAKEREIDAARRNIDSLVADIERARAGFAAKDAEIDAARRNIDSLVAEVDAARRAHGDRDATEAALRAELEALRRSRWFRLGRSLRLIDGRGA